MATRVLLLILGLLFVPAVVRAEEADDAPERAARAWDERSGWNTEFSVGNGIGFVGGRGDDGARRNDLAADTTVRVGLHHVGEFHGKSLIGLDSTNLSWCMPVLMCGPPGMLVGPKSGFLGNELGVDVAAHVLHGVTGNELQLGYAFGVRPSFRVARDSRFRTASFVGSVLPEIGLAFPSGRSREMYFEFSLYPLSMSVTRNFAIHWEVLRERLGVPLDGAPVSITFGTSLALMLL